MNSTSTTSSLPSHAPILPRIVAERHRCSPLLRGVLGLCSLCALFLLTGCKTPDAARLREIDARIAVINKILAEMDSESSHLIFLPDGSHNPGYIPYDMRMDLINERSDLYEEKRGEKFEEGGEEAMIMVWGATETRNTARNTARGVRPACFVAGTPVHTPAGPRPIEEIALGDEVLSFNESTGRVETARVTGTLHGERADLIDIDTAQGRVTCSANHSFYTSVFAWEKAEDLPSSATLLSIAAGNTVAPLQSTLTARNLDTPVPVYNFGVAGNHNYFAGEDAILCHNSPTPSGVPKK